MARQVWSWETLEGMVVSQRYELCHHLATGGMAAIFRGWDHQLGRRVAIKVMRRDEGAGMSLLPRFRREALIGAALQHPHLIKIFDFVEDEHFAFLCLELIDGIDLKEYITLHGALAITEACSIGIQMCQALTAMHARGFIHRDIKPQNILLDTTGSAKLADFGIVLNVCEHSFTLPGMVLGTAAYLAPEQAMGDILTPQTDLYALGVVLYEMVTGVLPFTGATAIAVALQHVTTPVPPLRLRRPDIPPLFERIIVQALAKKPEHRFSSAQILSEALEQSDAHAESAALLYVEVDERQRASAL